MKLIRTATRATALFVFCLNASAITDTHTFTPNPSDMYDLDHGRYYTWGFSDVASITGGAEITSAVLSFDNINNWDNSANSLFLELLDNAKYSYMSSTGYLKTYGDYYSETKNDFTRTSSWGTIAKTQIGVYQDTNGTGQTDDASFTFNSDLLQKLNDYIGNGDNFALGLDPDCHYWNDGVSFTITWETPNTPVPPVPDAGATFWLLACGLGALPLARRFLRA